MYLHEGVAPPPYTEAARGGKGHEEAGGEGGEGGRGEEGEKKGPHLER